MSLGHKIRASSLRGIAAIGFAALGLHAWAAECPLDLSLTSGADAYVTQLKNLPSAIAERQIDRPPFIGHCTYQVSTFAQTNPLPGGLCTIGGQTAMSSMVEIFDDWNTVVSHAYSVIKSDDALPAIKAALSRMGTAASSQNEPKAWTTLDSKHWTIDAVYANGDDLWTVGHELLEPGETQTIPGFYMVQHVRREWLDFANRDLNTCTALPEQVKPK